MTSLLALTCIATSAVAQIQPTVHPTKTDYLWGGIGQDSYLYWPTTPASFRPLELVKAGRRQEAFDYCFSRMKTTKGEEHFFYAIQAASLGFGLKKSHLVSEYLASKLKIDNRAYLSAETPKRLSNDEVLSFLFAHSLAQGSLSSSQRNPSWEAIQHKPNYMFALSITMDEWNKRSYSRAEHLCVRAELVWRLTSGGGSPQFDPRALQAAWRLALSKAPKSAEINLVLSRFSQMVYQMEVDRAIADTLKYAENALRLAPNNPRAKSRVGVLINRKDPRRAKLLLEDAVKSGGLLPSELAEAREKLKYIYSLL